MLSKRTVKYLERLTYNEFAEMKVSLIPLGGIFWEDELPDFDKYLKLCEHDRGEVLRLFSIRYLIWDGEQLSDDDLTFWESARQQVPDYALFYRLSLSEEDRRTYEETRDKIEEEVLQWVEDADEVSIKDKPAGFDLTLTYDLEKDEKETGP